MLAHRMTIKATVFSLGLIIVCLLLCFYFYYYMTNNLHLFYIDSAESKKLCLFEIRTENGVLPEQEICRPTHSDVSCWAWENTVKSKCNAMWLWYLQCNTWKYQIRFFLNMCACFFYIYWPKTCIVQYFLMLHILYCNPFAYFEAGLV